MVNNISKTVIKASRVMLKLLTKKKNIGLG